MKNKQIYITVFLLSVVSVAISIYLRLEGHPLNFAPLTAIALFGTAYLPKKWMGVALAFVSWIVSDIFVNANMDSKYAHNATYFYSITAIGVYVSLLLIIAFATTLRKGVGIGKLFGVTLGSSLIFFFVSNSFCFFIGDDMYGPGLAGYYKCMVAGIPFYRNTFLGDFFYVTVFFGSYYLVNRRSLKPVFA